MPLYQPASSTVTDATISVSDVTTNNASSSAHGWLKKLDSDTTHFMRGDGSWAVPGAATSVTFHGCQVTHSGGQSLSSGAYTILSFDTESYDTDAYHFTSSANLTGTVAKTASSATLVGTGTSFTTELTVGQVISVPGTAAEKRVVTVITDNTHLTVSSNFSNTASGQTAARVNSPLVVPTTGYYLVAFHGSMSSNPGAGSWWAIAKNATSAGNGVIAVGNVPNDSVEGEGSIMTVKSLTQWDYLEVHARAGAAVSAQANSYGPFFSITLLGV